MGDRGVFDRYVGKARAGGTPKIHVGEDLLPSGNGSAVVFGFLLRSR
jgi:hypothetical protein